MLRCKYGVDRLVTKPGFCKKCLRICSPHTLRSTSSTNTQYFSTSKNLSKQPRGSALAEALAKATAKPLRGINDDNFNGTLDQTEAPTADQSQSYDTTSKITLAEALAQTKAASETEATGGGQGELSNIEESTHREIWKNLTETFRQIPTKPSSEENEKKEESAGAKEGKTLTKKQKKKIEKAKREAEQKEKKAANKEAKKAAKKTERNEKKKAKRGAKATAETESEKWKKEFDVKSFVPSQLELKPVAEPADIPKLSYGLEKVLFNPGVYQLEDSRSGVFNFDPYLANIMPVDQFDFDALKAYITSSKDVKLREMSKLHGAKYCGSTSSMTGLLSHFHFLLSAWRKLAYTGMSSRFEIESYQPTMIHKGPAAAYARLKDGVYAIDADKEYDQETILSMLGKSMEKLLTLPKEEFEKYRKNRSHMLTDEEKNADEAYHYTTLGDFMMRSQLDAHDSRLPGTGVFDLKTRAVITIRMNMEDYQTTRGYEIQGRYGQYNSFEREYHDMIRSAFLKYSLQVRMGRMDGIFVAFHNTQRIFGFQYISLEEMDMAIHGTSDRRYGDLEFKASLKLLNELLDRATKRFPGRSLRLHAETRPTQVPLTYFFAEPVSDEEMSKSDEESKKEVEEVGREILRDIEENVASSEQKEEIQSEVLEDSDDVEISINDTNQTEQGEGAWVEMMERIEEIVENDSLGVKYVREIFQDTLDPDHEEDLDSLMQNIELLTSAAPGRKEIKEIAEVDADDVGAETAVSDMPEYEEVEEVESEEIESEVAQIESEEAQAEAEELQVEANEVKVEFEDAVLEAEHLQVGSEDAVPASGDVVTDSEIQSTPTTEPEEVLTSEDKELSEEHETTLAAESSAEPAEPVSTEDENGGESEAEAMSAGSADQADQKLKNLRDLIVKVTEEMGNAEGGKLQAFMTELAAKAQKLDAENEALENAKNDDYTGPKEVLGMYLTIRNISDTESVERISTFDGQPKPPKWSVEYAIEEMTLDKSKKIYTQLRGRRKDILSKDDPAENPKRWRKDYLEMLKRLAREGEQYRKKRIQASEGKPVYVAWDEKTPYVPDDFSIYDTGNLLSSSAEDAITDSLDSASSVKDATLESPGSEQDAILESPNFAENAASDSLDFANPVEDATTEPPNSAEDAATESSSLSENTTSNSETKGTAAEETKP